MRILVVGGTGTIGQAVVNELSPRHEMLIATHKHGDLRVDISDIKSIEKMYKQVGEIDAVIATTGKVHFGALSEMSPDLYAIGLKDKLMGQINLVSIGLNYLKEGGSFTLTSGIINRDPIRLGTSAAMVNGALDGFVRAAALELPRGVRVNAVSPTILTESQEKYADFFRGFLPVPVKKVALAYSKSVEGAQTGQIYCVN